MAAGLSHVIKYRRAKNVGRGKSWRKSTKFDILACLNLADLRLYISHAHSFKLLTRVSMEGAAEVTKFVLNLLSF